MPFSDLGLAPKLCQTLSNLDYERPTPIQQQAIPPALKGRDILGGAQTGTGKTAAFSLPIIQQLLLGRSRVAVRSRRPQVLVITPTRELALQVRDSFRDYGRGTGIRVTTVFGGVGMQPQVDELRSGVHVLVATVGRLLDHVERKTLDLSGVEYLVVDEADRMMDMGFLPSLRRIARMVPRDRQTLFFSATFAPEIRKLAGEFLYDAVEVQVTPRNSVVATVTHRVHPVAKTQKQDLLMRLLRDGGGQQSLVFCRTKHGSDRLCRQLARKGFGAVAIHGNKSQPQREKALRDFKAGRARVLIATDIAARGLDIEQLPVVVNYDLPYVAEDYVHRIGRTGRAGASGHAISLMSRDEEPLLRGIERLVKREIPMVPVEGFAVETGAVVTTGNARGSRPARGASGPARPSGGRGSERSGNGRARNGHGDATRRSDPKRNSRPARSKAGARPRGKAGGMLAQVDALLRRSESPGAATREERDTVTTVAESGQGRGRRPRKVVGMGRRR